MEYTIANHGDWLERQASDFIVERIPAYEQIWKRFIGHKGNGRMADMKNINESDQTLRIIFAQHHYTVLESLYFMKLIVEDESQTRQINSFDSYRKTINQIMAYQAYSGRLRDNIEKCFSSVGSHADALASEDKLDRFYKERHVFIHGRKVPFAIDADQLFKISTIKKDTVDRTGFGLEMPWDRIKNEDLDYLEDLLRRSFEGLTVIVDGLLSNLLNLVVAFVKEKHLAIDPPKLSAYSNTEISGSTKQVISASISGVPPASGHV